MSNKRLFFLWFLFWFLSSFVFGELLLEVRAASFFRERDFQRVPEFFTGREYSASKLYCRSIPEQREGFYFVIKLAGEDEGLSDGACWVLDWITQTDPAARSKRIPVSQPGLLEDEVFLGLTGSDWPDPDLRPLAWRIRLLGPQNQTLVERKSFLWSK